MIESPDLLKSIADFSDDELLGLLAGALKDSYGGKENVNRLELSSTLFSLKELLAEREALDLLPKLKESLGDLNLIDPKYLDLILASDSSPRKVAHLEIESFRHEFSNYHKQTRDDLYENKNLHSSRACISN